MAGSKFAHCNVQQHMPNRQAQYVPHRQFEAPRRTLGAQATKPQQRAPACRSSWTSRLGSARDAAFIQVLLYCALLQTLDEMKKLEAERLKAEQVPVQEYEWTEEDWDRFLGRHKTSQSNSPCSTSTSTCSNSDASSSPTSSGGITPQESSTHVTACPSTHTTGATQIQPVQQQQAIIIYHPAPFVALLTLFYAASRAGQHAVAAVADSTRTPSSSASSFLVCSSTSLVMSAAVPTINLIGVLCSDIIPSSLVPGYKQQQQQASMQLSMVRTRRCFILPLSAIVWVLQKRAARRSRRALLKSTPVSNTTLPASSSSTPLVPSAKCGKPQLSITIPDLVLNTPCVTPITLPCLDLLCEQECEEGAVVVEVLVEDSHHSMPGSKAPIKAAAALTLPLSPVKPLDSHPSLKEDDTAAATEENKLTVNPLTRLLSAISSRGGSAVTGVKESGKKMSLKMNKHNMGYKLKQLVCSCNAALSCSRTPAVAYE